ncbi:putative F-box/FBD/LRR-repeat protein At5g44950 isoform X4 [Malus sylvestris]|uniref:putative F-box/FBD/LRR-repeat protein At5g44950 isoform X4 n=1 Tax=Malus sylvestris TaxID=3752 RepID=UPI0021AC4993|nr:putative F-box/FBD/LRR-repeat protein At5g44950 isoform X4 [Malus sylvestris]
MDGNRKLMAAGSYQRRGVRAFAKSMTDRISDLPDGVAHHILSFLAITDLTRFGCVSKRCKQLYLSTPSLDIDVFSDAHMVSCFKQLLSSLDRFLWMHRGVNKIQRFRIYWDDFRHDDFLGLDFLEDATFRLMTWIHNAVSCNVEVLEVDIRMMIGRERRPLFPLSVFLCGSLKSLFLNMGRILLKAPSLTSSSNLEYLELRCVCIKDEDFFKWISSSCEKLEEICISWEHTPTGCRLLNIRAPNLKYLKWFGCLMMRQNLGELMCLEKAELSLMPEVDDLNFLSEVLCSISRVKVLTLNHETTMALFNGGLTAKLLGYVFHLCISIGSFGDILVPGMVSVFGGLHNLNTLEIKTDHWSCDPECCSGFDMGYWGLQNLSFIHQLKEVTIELCDGSNGIQFAKYILEHAQNLKKVKIVHSPWQCNDIAEVKKSKMASNIATVVSEEYGTPRFYV